MVAAHNREPIVCRRPGFGRMAASLRQAGRKVHARAYEAMIAAIAIANRLRLYTVDPVNFEGIADLGLRRITHPDER
jgi:predicted nucleic acid-binding protein